MQSSCFFMLIPDEYISKKQMNYIVLLFDNGYIRNE
jgi:hypothetical protein